MGEDGLLSKQAGHRESPRLGGGLHPFAEGLLRPGRGSNLSLSNTAAAAAETQPLLGGGQRGPTSGGSNGAPQDSKAQQSAQGPAALTVALPASFGGAVSGSAGGPSARVVQWFVTAAIALLYMGASGCAIVINKHILVDLSFPFPVTITWLGLLITTMASAAGVHLWLPTSSRRGVTLSYYLTHVMPCGFFMAVAFLTGNLSFLYLTLAFVQMLKASTPVVTMLLLFAFRLERPTSRLIVSVCVICLGVCLAGYGELRVSLVGLTSMLTSVVAESLRLVLMQFLMDPKGGELHPMEGLMYISSACMSWLLAQAMLWEWTTLWQQKAYVRILEQPAPFLVSACAGFAVNMLAIVVIKRASSLTLKVLGTVKDAALVVVGVIFLREHVSQLQLGGYIISLVGFAGYNVVKATASAAQGSAALSHTNGASSPSTASKLA